VIAHRGGGASAPENTLAGLRCARAFGCSWVEIDVRLTVDRELILLHDDRLERTTNGKGKASELPFEAVRGLDAGAWFHPSFAGERVPTFEEALAVIDEEELGAIIEIKAAQSMQAEEAGALLARRLSGASRPAAVLVSSFHPEALAAARAHAPSLRRAILFGRVPRNWEGLARDLGCTAIHADHRRLAPWLVAGISALGYSLGAYTVNDPRRAGMLLDWGVASVFSDAPHLILAETARRGCPFPAGGDGAQS
jgi:glycerophosphoryl diester phosphodiesterase